MTIHVVHRDTQLSTSLSASHKQFYSTILEGNLANVSCQSMREFGTKSKHMDVHECTHTLLKRTSRSAHSLPAGQLQYRYRSWPLITVILVNVSNVIWKAPLLFSIHVQVKLHGYSKLHVHVHCTSSYTCTYCHDIAEHCAGNLLALQSSLQTQLTRSIQRNL